MLLKKYFLLILLTNVLGSVPSFAQSNKQTLHQFFEEYCIKSYAFKPLDATFDDVPGYNNALPAEDEAFFEKKYRFYKNCAARLERISLDSLNKEDAITVAIIKSDIAAVLALSQHHPEYLSLNQYQSVPMFMAVLGSGSAAQPFLTLQDYENWLQRSGAFVQWTNVAIENLRKGLASGIVLPKALVLKIVPQLNALAKDDSTSLFYNPIHQFPSTFTEQEKEYLRKAFIKKMPKYIFASMRKLATFLEIEYLPKARLSSGIDALPNGKQMYKDYIFSSINFYMEPDSVFQLGLREVNRITETMEAIKIKLDILEV
jgi:uncharacterized protein (DUF885 family)